MIIFGWRARGSILGRGVFFCPNCSADRGYAHKRLRRWFTLFFIPLIPTKDLGELVQCDTCQKSFTVAVLKAPTTAALQDQLLLAIREAVVLILRSHRTAASEEAARAAVSTFAGHAWSPDQLIEDIERLDPVHLDARLAALGPGLNEQGKERFVGACAEVCATGGVIDESGRALVQHIAAGLLMTPAHTRGLIDQVVERSAT